MCLNFAIFNSSEKLPNIFEIGFKKIYGVIVQKSLLGKKKYFKKNIYSLTVFIVYMSN